MFSAYIAPICYRLNCAALPPHSNAEALTPSTLECDCM